LEKDNKHPVRLIPQNSLLSSSAFDIASKLQKAFDALAMNSSLVEATITAQRMSESVINMQNQSEIIAETFKKFDSIDFTKKIGAAFSQIERLQNFPFNKIAKKIGSQLEQLRFREFDLMYWPEEEIIAPQTSIITEASQIKKIIREIYQDHSFLYKLRARKFEEVIAELLHHKGFKVELTQQTRDNGYDILALQNLNGFPVKFLVECKRYAPDKPIGIGIIRSFCDVIRVEQANKGIICTTSYFTSPSKARKSKEGHLLDLYDREDLLKWVIDYLNIN